MTEPTQEQREAAAGFGIADADGEEALARLFARRESYLLATVHRLIAATDLALTRVGRLTDPDHSIAEVHRMHRQAEVFTDPKHDPRSLPMRDYWQRCVACGGALCGDGHTFPVCDACVARLALLRRLQRARRANDKTSIAVGSACWIHDNDEWQRASVTTVGRKWITTGYNGARFERAPSSELRRVHLGHHNNEPGVFAAVFSSADLSNELTLEQRGRLADAVRYNIDAEKLRAIDLILKGRTP